MVAQKKKCSVFRTMRADVNVVGFLVLCFSGVQQWDYKEIRATFISHHILYCSIIEVQRSQDSHLIADQTGDHTTPFAVCLKLCLTNTVSTTLAISDNKLFILKSL